LAVLNRKFLLPVGLLADLALLGLAVSIAPLERTLGVNIRLVYFHGAWVWAGLTAFACSAFAGLGVLIFRRNGLAPWSLAFSRTGLVFWLTYLPLSLLVMKLNWGGLYLDEPRWKIPLAFAVAGLLLQGGLALINQPALAGAGNLAFGAALFWSLGRAGNILHPDSPVFQSGSLQIKVFFSLLLFLSLLAGALISLLWKRVDPISPRRGLKSDLDD